MPKADFYCKPVQSPPVPVQRPELLDARSCLTSPRLNPCTSGQPLSRLPKPSMYIICGSDPESSSPYNSVWVEHIFGICIFNWIFKWVSPKYNQTEGEQSVKWSSVFCFCSIMNCSHWAGFKPKHLQTEEGWAFGDKRRWRLLGWPQLCPSNTGGGRRQPWWCVMIFFFVFLW